MESQKKESIAYAIQRGMLRIMAFTVAEALGAVIILSGLGLILHCVLSLKTRNSPRVFLVLMVAGLALVIIGFHAGSFEIDLKSGRFKFETVKPETLKRKAQPISEASVARSLLRPLAEEFGEAASPILERGRAPLDLLSEFIVVDHAPRLELGDVVSLTDSESLVLARADHLPQESPAEFSSDAEELLASGELRTGERAIARARLLSVARLSDRALSESVANDLVANLVKRAPRDVFIVSASLAARDVKWEVGQQNRVLEAELPLAAKLVHPVWEPPLGTPWSLELHFMLAAGILLLAGWVRARSQLGYSDI